MKHLISIILAAFVFVPGVWGQTEKGKFMLGTTTNVVGIFTGGQPNQAAIGFGTNKVGKNLDEKYTNLNLSFNAGFFVADGLMLGLDLGGWQSKVTTRLKDNEGKVLDESDNKQTNIVLAPKARYYLNQSKKMQYFGELRGGLLIQKANDEDSDVGSMVGAKAGGAYFLNQKVSLDFFFDFTGTFSEIKNNTGSNTNVYNGVMGLGVGFSFFL